MSKNHTIPIGTLVEVKYDEWHGGGACQKIHARLFVVEHGRDCDRTPLYYLSHINKAIGEYMKGYGIPGLFKRQMMNVVGGFCENDIDVIEITEEIKEGQNSLVWQDGN